MYTDPLKNTLSSFVEWRNGKDYRANVKTRTAMLAYCGITVPAIRDGKMYPHKVADYFDVAQDSENARGNGVKGYYSDNYGNAVIRFGVVKIGRKPGRGEGRILYAPFTYCTEWEGETIYICHATTDEDEAMRVADRITEREADECREEDAQFQAEQQIEDAREELHRINADTLPRIREIKQHGEYTSAVCRALRESIAARLADRARLFRRIEELQDNYWAAVNF